MISYKMEPVKGADHKDDGLKDDRLPSHSSGSPRSARPCDSLSLAQGKLLCTKRERTGHPGSSFPRSRDSFLHSAATRVQDT